MSISYYLACLETKSYVWIGNLGPQGPAPAAQPNEISLFALIHRNRPLIVVSDTHPILEEGREWSPTQSETV